MLVFTIALITALASTVHASPMHVKRCDVTGCLEALGPTGADCGLAAVQEGADVLNDGSCLVQALSNVASPPSQCSGCGSTAVNDVKSVADKVGSTLKAIF
ncbi:hypothetical protein PILCRDRAFT_828378 [Piloderma croceum F 1598]|uniref:Fungal calcium binding protein domain-containing protein n=1 Tax=Piloderma croceum (strain F 1598) TaxID=765440 RepID=A0A0C3AK37_PILCF|nr:hypothetical protein PILCRDRAFT_828378 [Piloderma croceum F 1598]